MLKPAKRLTVTSKVFCLTNRMHIKLTVKNNFFMDKNEKMRRF